MANLRAHNPDNYEVAKRLQLFARPHGSASAADWISLGSVKNVQIDSESTPLEHFSNYLGARAKDREETIERRLRIDFTLEEMNVPNLKLALGRGFRDSEAGPSTKDMKHDQTVTNPGAGGTIDLGKTDIKNVIVRSPSLEDDETYDELAFTDSTDDAQGGDFNNVTNPLTVVAAVTNYAAITFVVGLLVKIENEILRVTAVVGNDVTFARAQLGTVAAAHADGTSLLVGAGDYHVNLTTGILTILWAAAGALEDEETVPQVHVFFEQELDVEEFEIFDGNPVQCELQFQAGIEGQVQKILGPYTNCFLRNSGPISFGDGSDYEEIPMQAELTVKGNGSFGTAGIVKETQS
jgi:hypothetical protein